MNLNDLYIKNPCFIRVNLWQKKINCIFKITLYLEKSLINLIKNNNKILLQEIAGQLNISKRTIRRDIEKLKQQNKLKRIGTEKTGHWEIIN